MKIKQFTFIATAVAIVAALASCTKKDSTITTAPPIPVSNPIKSDTIGGFVKGTLLAGQTYTMNHSVFVKKGDTLLAQAGANIIVKNNSQFQIQGVLRVLGTQQAPVRFNSDKGTPGSWAGFACDSAQSVTLKWADVKNTGGQSAKGGTTTAIKVTKNIPVDIEDSWFANGQDDGLALYNGQLTILRNTIYSSGSTDGEGINIKGGATGIVAYNVVYSQAGTGIKLETAATVTTTETNIEVYNNTLVSNGWRRGSAEPGRGISVGASAYGHLYNNIIVNCYHGLEIFTDADIKKTTYGNNLFYASTNGIIDTTLNSNTFLDIKANFYPTTGVGVSQASDIISKAVGDKDPKFVNYDGIPLKVNGAANNNDFHLQTGSAAIGVGVTVIPNATSSTAAAPPSKDLGAYPTDGSGNKH
jgi:hypothetical protein